MTKQSALHLPNLIYPALVDSEYAGLCLETVVCFVMRRVEFLYSPTFLFEIDPCP